MDNKKQILYQKTDFNRSLICQLPTIFKCSKCKKNNNIIIENIVIETRDIVKGNKVSSEERKEQNRINKQALRDRLIAKYGDEEYRKMHAKQIAENRRKRG